MYYLGIDLGGTNIAIGIVDENLNIVRKGSVPTRSERDMDEIVKDMADLAKKLISEEGIELSDIAYAGIASPGSCDSDNGIVIYANNLHMNNYPICAKLTELLPLEKVYINNDANAAALGEAAKGAAKGAKDAVVITLGTGLGGGIIIDGKIYSGFNYAGGELGHTVIVADGEPCTCGRRGCWEAYSSATALVRMTRRKMEKNPDSLMWTLAGGLDTISGKTAFKAAREGDKAGQAVVDEFVKYLACGISNMINIFQPEILCIGGGVCNEGEYLLAPVREAVAKENYVKDEDKITKIVRCMLGNDAGIIGAAALGMKL